MPITVQPGRKSGGKPGNDHPTSMPTSVYPTSDGFVNIAAAGDTIYARMCDALGVPDLATHADYATAQSRSDNRVALNAAIAECSKRYASRDLITLLNDAGVPCGPINNMDEVFDDPQVVHLGMASSVPQPEGGELRLVGPAMRLSRTPSRMKRTIGPAGEHNEEILGELGFTEEQIVALQSDKVI